MKDKLDKLKKRASGVKKEAARLSGEAIKTAGSVKDAVETGVKGSKTLFGKGKSILEKVDKDKIKQGLEVGSKGAGLVAKGAHIASEGAKGVAKGMEKASEKLQDLGKKLNEDK